MVKNVDGKQIINSCQEILWNHNRALGFTECSTSNPEKCGPAPRTVLPDGTAQIWSETKKAIDSKCNIITDVEECNDNIFCNYSDQNGECIAYGGDDEAKNICEDQDQLDCRHSGTKEENTEKCLRGWTDIARGWAFLPVIILNIIIFWILYNSGLSRPTIITWILAYTFCAWMVTLLVTENQIWSECDRFKYIDTIDYTCLIFLIYWITMKKNEQDDFITKNKNPIYLVFGLSLIMRIVAVLSEGGRGKENYMFDIFPYLSNIVNIFRFDSWEIKEYVNPNLSKHIWIIFLYSCILLYLFLLFYKAPGFFTIDGDNGYKCLMVIIIIITLLFNILPICKEIDGGDATPGGDKCEYTIENSKNYNKIKVGHNQVINIECNDEYEGGGKYVCINSTELTDDNQPTNSSSGYNPNTVIGEGGNKGVLKDLFPNFLGWTIKDNKSAHPNNDPLLSLENTSFIWDKADTIDVSERNFNGGGSMQRNEKLDNGAIKIDAQAYVLHDNADKYISDANKHLINDKEGKNAKYIPIEVCRPKNNCAKITTEAKCELSDNSRCSYVGGKCVANPDGKQPSKIIMCNDDSFRFFVTDSFGTIAWCIFVLILLSIISGYIHPGKNKKTYFATGLKNAGVIVGVCLWMFITPNIISRLLLDNKACLKGTTNESLIEKCQGKDDNPRKKECELFGERCVYDEDDEKCKYNCSVNPFVLLREVFLGPKDVPERSWVQKVMYFIFKTLLAFIPYFILMKIIFKVAEKKGKIDNYFKKIGLPIAAIILGFVPLFLSIESQSAHPSILKRVSQINTDPSNIYCWVNNYGGIGPYLIYIIVSTFVSSVI